MDRFLSPSGLGVLRRTETIPLSLSWQKVSIHIAEYLGKDLEAGGDPSFLVGFLSVPSGGSTLGVESKRTQTQRSHTPGDTRACTSTTERGGVLALQRWRCQQWGSKHPENSGLWQSWGLLRG